MKMDDSEIEKALCHIIAAMQEAEQHRKDYVLSRYRAGSRMQGSVHLARCQAALVAAQLEIAWLAEAEYVNAITDMGASPNPAKGAYDVCDWLEAEAVEELKNYG
jgi:hypothetical protein